MPQPPYQVDQLQIEPGTTGTRLIDRDPTDGGLRFADPNVTAALLSLVGLRNITNLLIVGAAGDGAPYTAIQDAIDDAPDTGPTLIMVMAGEYTENLVIQKDGLHLIGVGRPKLTASVDATVWINDADPLTTPESVILEGFIIENTGVGEECVLIEGAGVFASGTVTVNTAPLTAGDTLTIGVNTLTGVAGSRASGSDNFSVDGVTAAAIAAELVAAINDAANSFITDVTSEALAGVVTITAQSPGVAGNSIALASSTVDMTASGATLTGGSAAGSRVLYDGLLLQDCDLVASGAGGYQIRADTVNNIEVRGGSWRGSATNSFSQITQCASFRVFGLEWLNDLELDYDIGDDQPAITTTSYWVSHCRRVGNVLCDLTGLGSLSLGHCTSIGDVTVGGDQTLDVTHSRIADLTVNGTVAASVSETDRGSLAGTGTVEESMSTGSVAFVASASEAVVFGAPQPDASYAVLVDVPAVGVTANVTTRIAGGFTITLSAPITDTVYYTVTRQM